MHLLGWDFLEKYHVGISFSQKGEIIIELDSSHQNNPPGELNDALTSFMCFISDRTRADSGNTDLLSLFNQLPLFCGQNLQLMLGKPMAQLQSELKSTPQNFFPELINTL